MGNRQAQEQDNSIFGEDGTTPRLHEKTAEPHQWPIVYSSAYNIGFLGMEKVHPFDSGKWGKIFNFLKGTRVLAMRAKDIGFRRTLLGVRS